MLGLLTGARDAPCWWWGEVGSASQSITLKTPQRALAKRRERNLKRGWAVPALRCHRLWLAAASPSLPLAPGQTAGS